MENGDDEPNDILAPKKCFERLSLILYLFFFKNYMDYLSRLYEREIKDFFEVAKIKMTGATKEGKKFGKGPTSTPLFCFVLCWNGK